LSICAQVIVRFIRMIAYVWYLWILYTCIWYSSYVWNVKHMLPFLDSVKFSAKLSNVQEAQKPIDICQNASYTGQAHSRRRHEMWANAHETRDSISLISYAGCLGLSPVISTKIHSSNVRRSLKSLQPLIFRFRGRSKPSMLVPPERSSAVLVMISSMSVSICNPVHPRLVDNRRNHAFWRGTKIWCARTEDSLN